jgi:hypothetical protein
LERTSLMTIEEATDFRSEAEMHPAAKFHFERTAREFSDWRSVPEQDRSPAPAWWWQPAIDAVAQEEEMAALLCYWLECRWVRHTRRVPRS